MYDLCLNHISWGFLFVVLQKSQQVLMRFDCFPGRPEQPGGRLRRAHSYVDMNIFGLWIFMESTIWL